MECALYLQNEISKPLKNNCKEGFMLLETCLSYLKVICKIFYLRKQKLEFLLLNIKINKSSLYVGLHRNVNHQKKGNILKWKNLAPGTIYSNKCIIKTLELNNMINYLHNKLWQCHVISKLLIPISPYNSPIKYVWT